jgi:hypothetical protein
LVVVLVSAISFFFKIKKDRKKKPLMSLLRRGHQSWYPF